MTAWASDVRLPAVGLPRASTAGTASPVRQEAPVPDAVLVARALGGDDRHAFAELVRRHQSPVRALLRRLAKGNHALADDLAQDTFLQVHRNLRQYRGDARFATWIYRIAYNCFLAHVRSDQPHAALPEELPAAAEARGADDAALRIDLDRALARLSDGERAAISYCYFHDLSHEEAAWVLGCPVGTVKTNVLRGKQKLRALLSAWAPPGTKENER